ncbi:PREDICTED: uncharacterized protein LOC107194563 [Dufourea novaeangliae]|uniref:uncharacterized protein LOC107194563 n=1 Tax=Dufourea novaeangliae TaxID=178035 RepID=UPI000766E330|nr:PREDICTED: uncharacterized protein LOC107194563 [Dufourea novaeangliae]
MSKEESSEEGPQGGGAGEAGKKDPNADLYESQGHKKLIRFVTVVAYMFSVSFVAIVLSAYYLFLWEPPNPRLLRRPVHLSGEPDVQFLLADPPVLTNRSEHSIKNNHTENRLEETDTNSLPKKLTGRILPDDDFYKDQTTKSRGKLDESLALLRNSLVEILRSRMNDSRLDRTAEERNFSREEKTKKGWIVMMSGL